MIRTNLLKEIRAQLVIQIVFPAIKVVVIYVRLASILHLMDNASNVKTELSSTLHKRNVLNVETHVLPVSTGINVIHARQTLFLEILVVLNVPIQRPSWEMYVLNAVQDAKCARTLTLARLVDPTPHSHQTSNAAVTKDISWTEVRIPASHVVTHAQHVMMLQNVQPAILDSN